MMNELELILRAQEEKNSGQVTDCFAQLVTLYQQRLFQYLVARCHNVDDAEDVLQETFINAFQYLHSYQEKWKFSTWLFTIANRLMSKHHKKYYNCVDINEELSIEVDDHTITDNNIWIQVKRIVNARAYDVLWFFYVEDLSIKDIAKILQSSQSWVKISLYRSKKKLAANQKIKELSEDFFILG